MAPEQLSGGQIDHRTDLFAVGVILFEMLTGAKPFRGKSITEVMSFMEKRGPEDIRALNPLVPEALKQVIGRSVAFDPAQRYVDAAMFSKAVGDALSIRADERQDAGAPTYEATVQVVTSATQIISSNAAFTEEILQQIERDLAAFIGPMASIALKRAARQSSDLLTLYEVLGRLVADPKDRALFLAKGRQRAAVEFAGMRPRPLPNAKTVAAGGNYSVNTPNPASIVAIESDLTRYIGPIARILVKRELQRFESLAKLCLVLATHIPDERERRAFLNEHGAE
jgi:serine/threonine-protein kinase